MPAKLRAVKPGDPNEPIDQYLNEVGAGSTSTLPYDRLMIFYRKNKMYRDELNIIDKGIKALKQFYSRQQKQAFGGRIRPSLKQLSHRISKSMGLHDKKGNQLFMPEPLPRWIKRREVTMKKLTKLEQPGKKKEVKTKSKNSATKKKAEKSNTRK